MSPSASPRLSPTSSTCASPTSTSRYARRSSPCLPRPPRRPREPSQTFLKRVSRSPPPRPPTQAATTIEELDDIDAHLDEAKAEATAAELRALEVADMMYTVRHRHTGAPAHLSTSVSNPSASPHTGCSTPRRSWTPTPPAWSEVSRPRRRNPTSTRPWSPGTWSPRRTARARRRRGGAHRDSRRVASSARALLRGGVGAEDAHVPGPHRLVGEANDSVAEGRGGARARRMRVLQNFAPNPRHPRGGAPRVAGAPPRGRRPIRR